MEKHRYGFTLLCSIIISLGLASFTSCIAAEFKRTKKKDLKLVGRLCYLPSSHAFDFGLAALISLFIAQIIGNFVICRKCCSGENRSSCEANKPTMATTLLLICWISFGIAIILLGAATNMNKRQPYGKGWLDGKCYVVKDGVFIGSAVLVLVTITSMLGSAIVILKKSQVEQNRKVHSQV